MVEQLSSPIANSVTWTLLHFLWQGSLIGLVYWALLEATGIRSARIRYATSLVALSVMALCPFVTFAVLYDSASTIDETSAPVAAASSAQPLRLATDPVISSEATGAAQGREIAHQDASDDDPSRAGRGGFSPIQAAVQASQPYVLLLWLAGVMLPGSRLTVGLLNVVWLRYGRTRIPTELADRSLVLARRLGLTTVRICASARIREAAVVGFWKPVVLLPVSWLTSLPTDVLEAAIAHELAHIRRFDVWVNLLQRILETLLFYHPMVWWLSTRIRLERELCCDELAVHATGERGNYVLALEQVGRLQVRGNLSPSPAFTGDRKMNLLSRIHYLLGAVNKKPDRGLAWLVGVMAVSVPLLFIGMGGHFPGQNAVAQDREGRRSVEGEGKRQSAEAEGERRSAEGDADRRRSAEGSGRRDGEDSEARGRRDGDGGGLRNLKRDPERRRDADVGRRDPERRRDPDVARRDPERRRDADVARRDLERRRDADVGRRDPERRRDPDVA
ncbi:MAG: M56 family metallopeptidase, partial [Planctomycetes bacterium]|nr:M56 family metallopeptidase [Planctomycetota bacterium]